MANFSKRILSILRRYRPMLLTASASTILTLSSRHSLICAEPNSKSTVSPGAKTPTSELKKLVQSTTGLVVTEGFDPSNPAPLLVLPSSFIERPELGEFLESTFEILRVMGRAGSLAVQVVAVDSRESLEDLERTLGGHLRSDEGIFNVIWAISPYSARREALSLRRILGDKKVSISFIPPKEFPSQAAALKDLSDLHKDELVVVARAPRLKKSVVLQKLKEMFLDSDRVKIERVIPVFVEDDSQGDNGRIQLIVKVPRDLRDNVKENKDSTDENTDEKEDQFSSMIHPIPSNPSLRLIDLPSDSPSPLSDLSAILTSISGFENPFIFSDTTPAITLNFTIDRATDSSGTLSSLRKIARSARDSPAGEGVAFRLVARSLRNSEAKSPRVTATLSALETQRFALQNENKTPTVYEQKVAESPLLASPVPLEFALEGEVSEQSVLEFIEKVKTGQAEIFLRSQTPPAFEKYSRRLVGSEIKEKVLDSKVAQAIFFYSKACGSCKKFLPIFEQLALENLKTSSKDLIFNRINNETNSSSALRSFSSTPRILLYRKDYKTSPFIYRNQILNANLLKDFLEVTQLFGLMDVDETKVALYRVESSIRRDEAKMKEIKPLET